MGDLKKSIEINAEDISEELIYKDLKCYILHIGEKSLIYIHTSRALDELYFGVVCEVTESGINVLNDKAGIGIDAQPLVDPQNVVCRTENGLLDRVGYFYTLSCWKFDEASEEGKIYRVPFEVGIEDDGGRTEFIQGTVSSEWMVVVV